MFGSREVGFGREVSNLDLSPDRCSLALGTVRTPHVGDSLLLHIFAFLDALSGVLS